MVWRVHQSISVGMPDVLLLWCILHPRLVKDSLNLCVGHESREDRNETDEPSDNSLNKICSPESADVEHLNNCTCDKGPSPNHLNNFNCVCAETSFQAGAWYKCTY